MQICRRDTLYRERRMGVAAIAQKLHVSKSTLYSNLRHRDVEIGPYEKLAAARPSQSVDDSGDAAQTAMVILTLRIENNNKFVRGKKRAIENIERYCLGNYSAKLMPSGDYTLTVSLRSDEDLDRIMHELLDDIASEADDRNCFSESDARMEGAVRHW